jgi:predicted secreted protein
MIRARKAVLLALAMGIVGAPSLSAEGLPQPYNQISFNVFTEREVANDWTTAIIGTTIADTDTATLAARVNKLMNESLAIARKTPGVLVSTSSYSTFPEYGAANQIVRWRATQDLTLQGRDTAAISNLLGTLQAGGLTLRTIGFSVSRETRTRLEDELMAAAITAFRSRAALITKSFGKTSYVIAAINIGDGGYQPPLMPYARSGAMMVDEATSPELEGGLSTLRIDISGTIELQ